VYSANPVLSILENPCYVSCLRPLRFCLSVTVIIGTAKYFTARRAIYGLSWARLPQNSCKRASNTKPYCGDNNLLASCNTCTGSYRNNLLSLSIQYLLRVRDVLPSGNSLSNPRLPSQYSTEHEFCTPCILLRDRGSRVAVAEMPKESGFDSLRRQKRPPFIISPPDARLIQ
jgi:hypothetical protein